MIVRILGEGQRTLPDTEMDRLNELDSVVEAAVAAGDEAGFGPALAALLEEVRTVGEPLPDDSLEDSDLILPPADATLAEVQQMLSDDGLIPG
jgi:hypothetical protein